MRDLVICCDFSSIDADYALFFTRMYELGGVFEYRHLFFLHRTLLTANSVFRDLSRYLHLKDRLFVGELAAERASPRK